MSLPGSPFFFAPQPPQRRRKIIVNPQPYEDEDKLLPGQGKRTSMKNMPYRFLEPDTEPLEMDGTEAVVPDGSRDIEIIGNRKYIEMFLSEKLVFPPDEKYYYFGYEDLDDLETIGQGSFGCVRKMLHRETGNYMAVKRVRIISSGPDDNGVNCSLKTLQKEVEAIKGASECDFIVKFYGITFHEGDGLVCMELMDISLEKLYKAFKIVQERRFPEMKYIIPEVIIGLVAVGTLKGLQHMKDQHHIMHRDVKPSNILLDRSGRVKLCDFGICGYLEDSVAQTKEAGCRPYMSPERLKPNPTKTGYDIRSDVWSLGITLVETATGRYPYPGFQNAPLFKQLEMVVFNDPPVLADERYSVQTRNFINACLRKDVVLRPTYEQLMHMHYFKGYNNYKEPEFELSRFVRRIMFDTKLHPEP